MEQLASKIERISLKENNNVHKPKNRPRRPTKKLVTTEKGKRILVERENRTPSPRRYPPPDTLDFSRLVLKFGKKRSSRKLRGLTPSEYTIGTSTIPNAGNGAFTNIFLKKGTVLGNYKGKRLSKDQYNRLRDQSYVWELSSRYGPIYIDGKNPKVSNWLRFLNDSRDRRVNVEPYQYRGNIYYRTTRNIRPEEELFISYGDEYWD
jgi:hypothetical protein